MVFKHGRCVCQGLRSESCGNPRRATAAESLTSGKLHALEGNLPQRFVLIAPSTVEKRGWYDCLRI